MAFNIPGVIAMALFYMLILGTGLWAARKARRAERKSQGDRTEVVLLGDRNIGLLIGVFTMSGMLVALCDSVIADLFYFEHCCYEKMLRKAAVITLLQSHQHQVPNPSFSQTQLFVYANSD